MNVYVQKSDGTTRQLEDRRYTLDEVNNLVGGYIDIKYGRLTDPASGRTQQIQLIFNEEGLLKHLPLNREASKLYGVPLVGDVVVITKKKYWLN